MKTGSFLDSRISKDITYSYHHRGQETLYLPDDIREKESLGVYNKTNGNLFYDIEVSWQNTVLIEDGVDIRIALHERCFIDHVELIQGASSGLGGIEVLCTEDGSLKKIGSYMPETGKLLTGREISVPVGYYCDRITIRLHGACSPIHLEKLDVWGAWELSHTVYPTPWKAEYKEERFSLHTLRTIKATGEDALFAAGYLCGKLKEKTGFTPEITETDGDIILSVKESTDRKDAFSLETGDGKCFIEASNRRGLLYAADTLLQLICDGFVTACCIEDRAFMEYRGLHLALPAKDRVEFIKQLIQTTLVPMRYNMVILEVGGAVRFERFPEINEAWLKDPYGSVGVDIWEKEELREFCALFTEYGIEVVPQIQSYGHTRYITMAYPWLAEKEEQKESEQIDLNTADVKPDEAYYNTMCPLHPEYYNVILGITEEVIEAVQPKRFVHMGHDEIYDIGKCPKCSKVPRGELFSKEVITLYEFLKKKNLTMMIWSDMLHDIPYGAPTAVSSLPRDIVMMDFIWYFYMDGEPEDTILKYDYPVMMGNMYSSHYPRFEKRARKKGIIGAEVSIWAECGEVPFAHKGKMYEFVYSGECMWSEDYRSDMRLTYNELIKPIIKEIRYDIGNLRSDRKKRHVLQNSLLENEVLDKEARISCSCISAKNIPYDIREQIPYQMALAAELSNPVAELSINDYADIITMVHATEGAGPRLMWKPLSIIGQYMIHYEDDTTYVEDLHYAGNIYKYCSTYGDRMRSRIFRHEGYAGTYLAIPECGKTVTGEDYTLGHYSFRNPCPEKKIKNITIKHAGDNDTRILLFDVYLQ